jgi:hypothetical protein
MSDGSSPLKALLLRQPAARQERRVGLTNVFILFLKDEIEPSITAGFEQQVARYSRSVGDPPPMP